MALLPEHGGLFAYLTSVLLSNVMFEKKGWSEGDDVISTVGRARFWLENKDLDMAAREVNSLKGGSSLFTFVLHLLRSVFALPLPVPFLPFPGSPRLTRISLARAGWPKALASDWLKQARSHLEVKQALEVGVFSLSRSRLLLLVRKRQVLTLTLTSIPTFRHRSPRERPRPRVCVRCRRDTVADVVRVLLTHQKNIKEKFPIPIERSRVSSRRIL